MKPSPMFKNALFSLCLVVIALQIQSYAMRWNARAKAARVSTDPDSFAHSIERHASKIGKPKDVLDDDGDTSEDGLMQQSDIVDILVSSGIEFSQDPLKKDLLDRRIVLIATDVNAETARKTISALLLLDARDHAAPIELYVRTEGGWVSDAFAIIDVMRSIQAPVNVRAVGGTYSAGTMILAAGTGERVAYPNSAFMFHAGNETDDGEFGMNRFENERLKKFWRQFPQVPRDWIDVMGEKTFYFGPDEALKFGIVDKVMPPRAPATKP